MTTLDEAKRWTETERRKKEGCRCPCCGLYNKVYRRKLNSGMAYFLIKLCRMVKDEDGWVVVKWGRTVTGDYSKLRYWGIIEQKKGKSNTWRVTPKGSLFVLGCLDVPRYAFIFDSQCLGFSKEQTSIHDALGDKFDYTELMYSDAECGKELEG